MAKALVIASWHDAPTTIAAYSASLLADKLKEKGLEVSFIYGLGATRLYLLPVLLKPYDMVVYSGHGSKDAWVGNDFILKMINRSNADWLSGRIAIGIPVCLSASILGNMAVTRGATAFYGSTDLMWCAFPEAERNYMADFIDCWHTIPLELADGATTGEALKAYKEKCSHYIDVYRSSKLDLGEWYADALEKNRDYYTLIGRSDVTLEDVEKTRKEKPNMRDVASMVLPTLGLASASVIVGLTLSKLLKP